MISNICKDLRKQYDVLIDQGKLEAAHRIVENFKKDFEGVSYFKTIPCVNELLMRDTQHFKAGELSESTDSEDKEDYDRILNKILKSI